MQPWPNVETFERPATEDEIYRYYHELCHDEHLAIARLHKQSATA